MAYQQKTQILDHAISDWLATLPPNREEEARALIDIFAEVTGWQPRLYTGGMLGFGHYAYTYASGHSGTAFATGFSPRKAEISLYILQGQGDFTAMLARLGKHRQGKACLYLKRLSDADETVLRDLIALGLTDLQSRWTIQPT